MRSFAGFGYNRPKTSKGYITFRFARNDISAIIRINFPFYLRIASEASPRTDKAYDLALVKQDQYLVKLIYEDEREINE
uniref:Uncharacterized protein n=1 Tax=Candidatus Kentrum sp. TC TaxID=2126339 RepID=A0A450YN12_9GAMM|nr:MAG: hypothetical protein BECKTC1821D_GA0114238_101417 [Candidatus Kentron sp. TC]